MGRESSWTARALTCALLFAGCSDDTGAPQADAGPGDGALPISDAGGIDGGVAEGGLDAGGLLDAILPAGDTGAPAADGAGPIAKGKVLGRVTYADGTALGQVQVRIGSQLYRSDSRGVFSAADVGEGEQEISIDDAHATAAQVRVSVQRDQLAQTELFVLPLKRLDVAAVESGGDFSDSADPDQVKVRLPANGLTRLSSGTAASGPAEVRYGVLKQAADVKAAPARLTAVMADHDVDLESFGAIDLRVVQNEEALQLSAEADLELPLGPNSLADQSQIDSWSFDPGAGRWRLEGKATIDKSVGTNGIARLKLTHLSWWTVAEPAQSQTCLTGKLLSDTQQPLSSIWVDATGSDYWGSSGAFTDAQGQFCLNVKQGSSNTLSAFGLYATSYFEWKQDASAGSTAASCGAAGCADLGNIVGTSLFDQCTGDVTHDQNHVLILSSGDTELDGTLTQALMSYGHVVTVGVPYTQFDGTVDLSPYDAVYLQANQNWGAGDMPVAGQRQLINWVNCGGGLVTTEWTTWKIGSGSFQLIDAIFPAARTTAYSYVTTETYVKATPDDTINTGLPDSFTFTTTDYGGTESQLTPRPGAATYYTSMMMAAGLLGWSYNLGRVASFSTTVGTNEAADANFMRLLANTLDWTQRDPAAPVSIATTTTTTATVTAAP